MFRPSRLLPWGGGLLMTRSHVMLLVGWLSILSSNTMVVAEFGDYVDPTFNCPAKTTCPQVCVATKEDCPWEMACKDTEMLCADGSCAVFCDPSLLSPCSKPCAPVACPKIVAAFELCMSAFNDFYDFADSCDREIALLEEGTHVREGPTFTWTDPIFIAIYCWILGVSAGIVLWCWYNHRINPVEGSTKSLQISASKEDDSESSQTDSSRTLQTGYKRHPVGVILYVCTLVTFMGWFGLLAGTSYLYYKYNEDEEDLVMSLKAFSVVWNLGLIWSFILKWPKTIESLFWRRCPLTEASRVVVYHEIPAGQGNPKIKEDDDAFCPVAVRRIIATIHRCVEKTMVFIFADPCTRPDNEKGILEYCPVHENADGSRYFVFLFRRYNFDETRGVFVAGSWVVGRTFAEMAPKGITAVDDFELQYEAIMGEGEGSDIGRGTKSRYRVDATGLSNDQVMNRYHAVGPNIIDMVKPSYITTFCDEINKPFYVYQFYILWIWITIQYWYMACVNWSIILLTVCVVSWFRYGGAVVLFGLTNIIGTVIVLRDGEFHTIDQTRLVPGDIIKLGPGVTQCDMVLLTGESVVDESALTGEATPQAKSPIDPNSDMTYDPKLHKKKSIAAGTKVLECEDALALVINTASYTMKGELLRDIIAFRQHTPKLQTELPIVVAILSMWASLFFLIVVFNSSDEPVIAWSLGMCAFSNAFPALLPITFTVPVGVSFNRLAKSQIACCNSNSILIAGKVSKAFFDKTGTLTNQGLGFISARSVGSWDYGQWTSDEMAIAMATCHCLNMSAEGAIIGNPVDRAMFAASKATLVHATGISATIKTKRGMVYKVVRRYDFDHNSMTQSVIVRLTSGELKAIVKGSGENVSKKCKSLPASFQERFGGYSRAGLYQIAVAWKDLPSDAKISSLSRASIESDLDFLGLLNFSNQLREETPGVIRQLKDANIQSIMLTGDSLFTGVYIARKSGLIEEDSKVTICQLDETGNIVWSTEDGMSREEPPLVTEGSDVTTQIAMTGEAWSVLLQKRQAYAIALASSILVFGRCSPLDKVSVVDTFVGLDFVTMMVGDGGNDCGALKAAHVGLALSDSDASIVAPFTSLSKDIGSVLTLLKEGRAALASTLAAYKYVIMYGQISSYNQLIMYKLNASFSDWQWATMDGIWTVSFSLTLPLARAALKLSKSRPTSSIVGWQTVSSCMGMMAIHFSFMAIALAVLFHEDWFQCRKWDLSSMPTANILQTSDNYEVTVIFLVTGFQCVNSAMTFNFGYEFRRNWFMNWVFVLFSLGYTFILFWITLVPGSLSCFWRVNCVNEYVVRGVVSPEPVPVNNPFNTTIMPEEFRWKLLFIMIGNGLAVAAYDFFVVNGIRRRKAALQQKMHKKQTAAISAAQEEKEDDNGKGPGSNEEGLVSRQNTYATDDDVDSSDSVRSPASVAEASV